VAARLRVGVVGAGLAGNRHLDRLRVRLDVEIAGVADPSLEQRQQAANRYGIEVFETAEALLTNTRVDLAFICLPPDEHGPVERLCITLGIPMLVEKPIAANAETAGDLAALIADSGLPVAVGYQWRQLSFLPSVRALIAGRSVNLVVASWMCPSATAPWWGDVRRAGGQFVEQATHLIDLAISLNGPLEVLAGSASRARVGDVATGFPKASSVLARFENGAAGSFVSTCTLAAPYRRSVEILADDLTIVITDEGGASVTSTGRHDWPHEPPDLYVREHDALIEFVGRGETSLPLALYAEAVTAHRTACLMEEAMRVPASGDR
jgi:predicted dehydrogenase